MQATFNTIESNVEIDTLTIDRMSPKTIEQLESLGEDLLDVTSIVDLESWLRQN